MWEFETRVAEMIPRTPSIRSFRFPIAGKGVRYLAGQFFFLNILINGEEAEHHFSFSSSPTEKGYIEFTKRITGSDFSQALARLKPGDWARLQGPEGHFTLPRNAHPLAFLSGGIGITPLRSMMRYIVDRGLDYSVVLLYGNASLEDAAFREELDKMAAAHANLRVVHVLSGPDFPPGWSGPRGYINTDIIRQTVPDFLERTFYISGPPRMVLSLQEQLSALHLPERQAKRDSFTGYD